MSRCEEHDVNEWACVVHPRTGRLVHFKRAYRGGGIDFTGSQLHGARDPLETDEVQSCSDGAGRIYPFPHWHPHNGSGVCVRCGQAVDPAKQPVAHGYSAAPAPDPLPRPASDHCRPGRCMGLTCCSYECSQGRCPSIPAEFRESTP